MQSPAFLLGGCPAFLTSDRVEIRNHSVIDSLGSRSRSTLPELSARLSRSVRDSTSVLSGGP